VWDSPLGQSWNLNDTPQTTEWHLTFRQLEAQHRQSNRNLADAVVELDVVDLGMCHMPAIEAITQRFAQLVSDDNFTMDVMTPAIHWATILLLWIRKVHQCITAAGTSLVSTHAVRTAKEARRKVMCWEKRARDHAAHEKARDDERLRRGRDYDTVAHAMAAKAQQMQELSERSWACAYNGDPISSRHDAPEGEKCFSWMRQGSSTSTRFGPRRPHAADDKQQEDEGMSERLGSKLPSSSLTTKTAPLKDRNSAGPVGTTPPRFEFMLPG